MIVRVIFKVLWSRLWTVLLMHLKWKYWKRKWNFWASAWKTLVCPGSTI